MAKTPKPKPEPETADQAPADVVQAAPRAVEVVAEAPQAATGAEAETAAIKTAAPTAETLLVTGPKSGRRRAGRLFGADPVTLLVDELAEGDLAAIEADPLLRVTRVAAPY